jgi:hypothetical protein
LTKRQVELTTNLDKALPNTEDRCHRVGDIDVMAALAAAPGVNAITVLAFYVSFSAVAPLYSRPLALWLLCPLLLYWLSRLLIVAHRRKLDDDPIVYALKDGVSRYVVTSMIIVVPAAI